MYLQAFGSATCDQCLEGRVEQRVGVEAEAVEKCAGAHEGLTVSEPRGARRSYREALAAHRRGPELRHSRRGLDKLEVYGRLGVQEDWFWMKGALTVHVLRSKGSVRAARSAHFPTLDLKQLSVFARHPSRARAPQRYRAALRRRD